MFGGSGSTGGGVYSRFVSLYLRARVLGNTSNTLQNKGVTSVTRVAVGGNTDNTRNT